MTIDLCSSCQQAYPEVDLPHVCPKCGGVFHLAGLEYPKGTIPTHEQTGLWRYRDAFGLAEDAPQSWLGEGQTPLVPVDVEGTLLYFKCEQLNPSGSFKDRGTAVLVSQMRKRGITEVVEDSSGNAGASLSMYATAFGIKCRIYVPASTSGPKRHQIEACGAKVIEVQGVRENAHKAVLTAVDEEGLPYASHALQPFGLSGMATIGFEIFEQLGRLPGTIISPVGHGSLLLGTMLGTSAVERLLGLESQTRFIGVQPANCAPLVAQWQNQPFSGTQGTSLAEGTQVENPSRGPEILEHMRPGVDDLVIVTENDIFTAKEALNHLGFYVEPTSAMVLAAWRKMAKNCPPPVVLLLSGSGLKSIH